jgi:uncharacterized membrane protein YkvA (DUF1232 family)
MSLWFSRARSLIFEVPRYGKLAYCLLRDERVPKAPKAALLTSLGLIASPIDLPAWIPIVGEFDMLALGVLAVRVFVESCPEELVREHEAALAAGTSAFDRDLRGVFGLARDRASEAIYRLRSKEIA